MDYKYISRADTTKLLKADLKKHFPTVKFSVTCEHRSVNVRWTDGPTEKSVNAIAKRYEGESFDGMTDSASVISQTRAIEGAIVRVRYEVSYVFVSRHLTPAAESKIAQKIKDIYHFDYDFSYPDSRAWQVTCETAFA